MDTVVACYNCNDAIVATNRDIDDITRSNNPLTGHFFTLRITVCAICQYNSSMNKNKYIIIPYINMKIGIDTINIINNEVYKQFSIFARKYCKIYNYNGINVLENRLDIYNDLHSLQLYRFYHHNKSLIPDDNIISFFIVN